MDAMSLSFKTLAPTVGPTSDSDLVANELKRIAPAWGASEHGYSCRFVHGVFIVAAWLGKHRNIVATAADIELGVALRRLAASLMEVDGQ